MTSSISATWLFVSILALPLALAACGDEATLSESDGYGPNPKLPEPKQSWIPTVNIAPAKGWSPGEAPKAAPGLTVSAFAMGLEHPRWLYRLPNGDILVAESNAPAGRVRDFSIRQWATSFVMRRAGATVPSPNKIMLLRDEDGDGAAEVKTTFLAGLNSPFGMTLIDNDLYVANTDAVVRFPYRDGATEISAPGVKVADLPAGERNHHWTKNIIASPDGKKIYATVGSNSNVGENGMEIEERRAAILEIDVATGGTRVFASGLRNPNGLDWNRNTGALWTVVNERDEIGGDLVPDYLTSVQDGGFYGWPYSYFGKHVDQRVQPQRQDLVEKAIVPDYALGAHTASLGLTFYDGTLLPASYRGGAFVGQHGSWNRKPRSGYKVIFVPFSAGKPTGRPQDVLTGFVNEKGEALGRPVGVIQDKAGALLVADDVGNAIWRVTAAP